jgi:Tol biopolymer transport system component
MELIEGETLANRLERGPLPPAEVLKLGQQLADALDRAHRSGLVHRDLKPGNVMLTRGGAKLLDFGLARAVAGGGVSGGSTQWATRTEAALTAEGAIVGTCQYMAPEQLEGKEADARSDLWALGATLYESATGRRAFQGASQASLISSILRDEPRPISELSPMSPVGLDRLVRACLAKDPEERIQTAHDLKLQLQWLAESGSQADARPGSQAGVTAAVVSGTMGPSLVRRGGWVAWGVAALALATAGWLGALRLLEKPPTPIAVQASVLAPRGVQFSSSLTNPLPLAIAPDGSRVAFCARDGEGPDRLWVRSLAGDDARPLEGTDEAQGPFFSPDGRSIAFFANRMLKRVGVAGGPVLTLAGAPDPRGGTWGKGGVILFSPDSQTGIHRVSAEGGAPSVVTVPDAAQSESTHRYPSFLPDGRHFLYLMRRAGAGSGREPEIRVGDLESPRHVKVAAVASNAVFASGHVLYVHQGVLMAQPFDPDRLEVTGPAATAVPDVLMDERFSRGVFSVSQNGVIVHMSGTIQTKSQLQWMARDGRLLDTVGDPADYAFGGVPMISPDGASAAMAIVNPDRGTSDIWIVNLSSGVRRRLTVDEVDHFTCTWSSDGRKVFMNSLRGREKERYAISYRQADGTGPEFALVNDPQNLGPDSASPDGRHLVYTAADAKGVFNLMAVPIGGDPRPMPLADGPASESNGQFSPDGRLVVFNSDESGRDEIYVVTFPPTGAKWQVSQNGGSEPRWSRDGRELFYFDSQNKLISVEVHRPAGSFEPGASRTLLQFHGAVRGQWRYDVAPDGTRFLVTTAVEEEGASPITVRTDWTSQIGK